MNEKRWLQGVRSPSGVMHLHDVRKRTARMLCGAAAISASDGRYLWKWHTGWERPSCTKCVKVARTRYGVL